MLIDQHVEIGESSKLLTTSDASRLAIRSGNNNASIRSQSFGTAAAFANEGSGNSFGVATGINRVELANNIEFSGANTLLESAGTVSVENLNAPDLLAFSLGIAGSASQKNTSTGKTTSLAGVGSYAQNIAELKTDILFDSIDRVDAGGAVFFRNRERADIEADAGGLTLALAATATGTSPTASVGVGAAIAINQIGSPRESSTSINITDTEIIAADGDINVQARSKSQIDALAYSGALAGSRGNGLSVSLAGAGSQASNEVRQDVIVSVEGTSALTTTASGDIDVGATNKNEVLADAGGVSVALALGLAANSATSGAVGSGVATNNVGSTSNLSSTSVLIGLSLIHI